MSFNFALLDLAEVFSFFGMKQSELRLPRHRPLREKSI
jgi:hypothetical protein